MKTGGVRYRYATILVANKYCVVKAGEGKVYMLQ